MERCSCNLACVIILPGSLNGKAISVQFPRAMVLAYIERPEIRAISRPQNPQVSHFPQKDARPFYFRAAMHLPCRVARWAGIGTRKGIARVARGRSFTQENNREGPTGSVFFLTACTQQARKLNDIRSLIVVFATWTQLLVPSWVLRYERTNARTRSKVLYSSDK